MTSAAKEFIIARRLRVSIHSPDPVQRARLRRIIAEAGHECVDTLDAADVVLSDGDCPVTKTHLHRWVEATTIMPVCWRTTPIEAN
jgi:hypothetical protein